MIMTKHLKEPPSKHIYDNISPLVNCYFNENWTLKSNILIKTELWLKTL